MANRHLVHHTLPKRDRRRYKGGGGRRRSTAGVSDVQKEINKSLLKGQEDLAKRIDKAIKPPKVQDVQTLQPLPEEELPALPPVPIPPTPIPPQSQFYDYTTEIARGSSRRRANRRRGLQSTQYAGETGGYQPPGTRTTLG